MTPRNDVLLSVRDLVVSFDTDEGEVEVLDQVGFDLHRRQTLGIVGESGCGKSVTSLAIMRLLPKPSGKIKQGRVLFDGRDILSMPVTDMHNIRGRRISMIFQEPMTALNPVHKLKKQLSEVYKLHFPDMSSEQVHEACVGMLEKVGMPDPNKRMEEYPHQLSGGMRQRAMIAMALACKPDILIADEPTTALDVTTQNQILNLIRDLQDEINMSVVFITHDLGVIAEICDYVIVMYAGRVVEQAPAEVLFTSPRHPYTKGLLESIPRLETPPKSGLHIIKGMVPSLQDIPAGCCFRTRCDFQSEDCGRIKPEIESVGDDGSQSVACLRWREISL